MYSFLGDFFPDSENSHVNNNEMYVKKYFVSWCGDESNDTRKLNLQILKHPNYIHLRDECGNTPLIMAIQIERVDMVRLIMRKNRKALLDRNDYGLTALDYLLKHVKPNNLGRTETKEMGQIIEICWPYVPADYIDGTGQHILICALLADLPWKHLINNKTNPNMNINHKSLLAHVISLKRYDVATRLMALKNFDPNDPKHATIWINARYDFETLKFILKDKRFDLGRTDVETGRTLLIELACCPFSVFNNNGIIDASNNPISLLLFSKRSDPWKKDKYGWTALFYLCVSFLRTPKHDTLEIIKQFLDSGEDVGLYEIYNPDVDMMDYLPMKHVSLLEYAHDHIDTCGEAAIDLLMLLLEFAQQDITFAEMKERFPNLMPYLMRQALDFTSFWTDREVTVKEVDL